MFDVAPTELLLVAAVALVVIGPKDLPRAMRFVGQWMAKARGVARHFRTGIDEMIRQSELEEMEKKWAAENERIMREHPAQAVIEHAPVEHTAIEAPTGYDPVEYPTIEAPTGYDPVEHLPTVTPGAAPTSDGDMIRIADSAQASLPLDAPPAAPKKARAPRKKPAEDA